MPDKWIARVDDLEREVAGLKRANEKLQGQVAALIDALADCVAKSTNYGVQDGEFVAFYISPTGPVHRAIPLLQEFGVTVRPGFDGLYPCEAEHIDKPSDQGGAA